MDFLRFQQLLRTVIPLAALPKVAAKENLNARHLTPAQCSEIAATLEGLTHGPVSIAAPAEDREALNFENEIAHVLEEKGFEVEIENPKKGNLKEEIADGLEMTVKDETIRPAHASGIVHAFRRAGIVVRTKINSMRRRNNTLYIAVGSREEDCQRAAQSQIKRVGDAPERAFASARFASRRSA
jgi:hypothetical protein